MKKSIRIIALALVAVMLCLSLTACGKKLSGTYETEYDVLLVKYKVSYEFSGSKVEATREVTGGISGKVESVTFEGEYEIKDDKITFTWDTEDEEKVVEGGTFTFAETDNGIKIGTREYTKK